MENKNVTIKELRAEQYQYNGSLVKSWKVNPYTWLKARFYMESSAVLVYLLLKTKLKPNTITLIYGLLGMFGGILLAVPMKASAVLAAVIFFSKGVLDWSDGHLARRTDQLSLTGAVLDPYGTFIGAISLQVGLGFYVAHRSGLELFYYLTALIPFCYAMKITGFAYDFILQEQIKSEKLKKYRDNGSPDAAKNSDEKTKKISRYHSLIANFLDDRARTTDFICLLVLIETFSQVFITWIIFLGFVIKALLIFSASLYVVSKGGWVEKKIDDKISEILAAFNSKR